MNDPSYERSYPRSLVAFSSAFLGFGFIVTTQNKNVRGDTYPFVPAKAVSCSLN